MSKQREREANRAAALRRAYQLARDAQGHQHWWPAELAFEMCVGAILTQNTNWSNVRRAIDNLRAAGVLEARAMYALPEEKLAALIQPAGYFNVKARRLRAFLRVLVEEHGGELVSLFAGETPAVRERLLSIHGIGRETADSMLLYAGGHLSFVVDAYTVRIFKRHRWSTKLDYDSLQQLLIRALNPAPEGQSLMDYWQDYHAQVVAVGSRFCRPRGPLCSQCPLRDLLPIARCRNSGAQAKTKTITKPVPGLPMAGAERHLGRQ